MPVFARDRRAVSSVIVISLAGLVFACSKSSEHAPESTPPTKPLPAVPSAPADATAAPSADATGWYRAVIGDKQGTAIPFFLQVPATGDEALIATGPDRVHAKLVARAPKLIVEFDILHTRIEATPGAGGVLDGVWASTSKSWGTASLSFHAEPVAAPDAGLRFPAAPGPDPTGVWKLTLTKPTELGKLTVSKGAAPNEFTATFAFQTGNLAFIAGNQQGRTLRMSAFDGSSPYLFVGELDEAGKTLTGSWTAGQALDWKEQLKGAKTSDFVLEKQTKLVAARPKLNLPLLAQPPYRGKPVIVELGGSWCPACGHAVAALRDLKTKYGPKGLQIVTLAYEFTDDAAYNKQAADSFKAKFQIPWDVIPIDGGLEKYGDILPSELDSIAASGFPLTLFVAPDGGIEGFHNGFPPEKWGTLHQQTLDDYNRLTAKIVSEGKDHP